MLRWLKGVFSPRAELWGPRESRKAYMGARSEALAAACRRSWEREVWERHTSRDAYIRAKAREHIEIMKAVREMEGG